MELEFNELFLRNVLGRVEWDAMRAVLGEVGLRLPLGVGEEKSAAAEASEAMELDQEPTEEKVEAREEANEEELTDETLRKVHELLMETQITSGKLVCGNCGHEYAVREGIPNFLLPGHLV